jgi:hypothetical protein
MGHLAWKWGNFGVGSKHTGISREVSNKKEDCTNTKLGCCRTPRLVVTLGLLQEDGSGGSKPCSTPSEIPISWYWSRLTRLDVLSPIYLTF